MPDMTDTEYQQYLKELEGGAKFAYKFRSEALDTARVAPGEEIGIGGKFLYVGTSIGGTLNAIYIRFNHPSADAIPADFASGIPVDFTRLYLTSGSQSGKSVYLLATQSPIPIDVIGALMTRGVAAAYYPATRWQALMAEAGLYIWDSASSQYYKVISPTGDSTDPKTVVPVMLMGFDGSTLDRLAVYATGILKVARAEAGISTARLTIAGNFKATAGKLYWLTIRPSAAVWLCALTNQATTGGTVVWDIGDPVGSTPFDKTFDPPLEFSTAIRLETATNLASATAGYI